MTEDMREVLEKLRGLITREQQGPDQGDWAPEDLKVVRLSKLLFEREKTLAKPEPPRGTIGWYFHNPGEGAEEASEALYAALPTLLYAWLKDRNKT
jgi:hypothetical protein